MYAAVVGVLYVVVFVVVVVGDVLYARCCWCIIYALLLVYCMRIVVVVVVVGVLYVVVFVFVGLLYVRFCCYALSRYLRFGKAAALASVEQRKAFLLLADRLLAVSPVKFSSPLGDEYTDYSLHSQVSYIRVFTRLSITEFCTLVINPSW